MIKVILDVPSKEAALFAMRYLQNHNLSHKELVSNLEYIGRYMDAENLTQPIEFIQKKFSDDLDGQYALFNTMQQGLRQRGVN
ncbi:hypothetical protein [Pedobacter panaciterrae]